MSLTTLNIPAWSGEIAKSGEAFQEVWYLKMNDPATNRALWLRFSILVSHNGFRRLAEVWAIYFQRNSNRDLTKTAIKQSFDIQAFRPEGASGGFSLGNCEFSDTSLRGSIQSKGRSIQWDLKLTPNQEASFNFIPSTMKKYGFNKNSIVTVQEDLRVSGKTVIDGETIQWDDALGMQGHLSGAMVGHSWIWGHCNVFVNDQGKPVPFVFEGVSGRAKVFATVPTPRLSAFYFNYQGRSYEFNTLMDSLRIRSRNTATDWEFQADRGDLSFRGKAKAEHRDFAGIVYEDVNGSILYCSNSKLSDMQIHVYNRGKLESAFYANGTAALEIVSKDKNPYVPILL